MPLRPPTPLLPEQEQRAPGWRRFLVPNSCQQLSSPQYGCSRSFVVSIERINRAAAGRGRVTKCPRVRSSSMNDAGKCNTVLVLWGILRVIRRKGLEKRGHGLEG